MTEETSDNQENGADAASPRVPFWKARSSLGRRPSFDDHEQMWCACAEYFAWVDANPLLSVELVKFQGAATQAEVPKMRAMTIAGLCIFLDISQETWFSYAKRPEFSEVATQVDQIIRTQKFEGASADLLNSNIIARDLGLVDKQEHEVKGVLSREPVSAEQWAKTHSE